MGRAVRHGVPAVNNTNVDRSVATIHATVLGCLRRQARVRLTSHLQFAHACNHACNTPSLLPAACIARLGLLLLHAVVLAVLHVLAACICEEVVNVTGFSPPQSRDLARTGGAWAARGQGLSCWQQTIRGCSGKM